MPQKAEMKRPVKRTMTIRLGQFTANALAGKGADAERVGPQAVRAMRYYLGDSDSDRPEWPYPVSLGDGAGAEVELVLSVDEDLWRSFEREAERQGVAADLLVEHAALYYAADRDAGRVTQRILDHLEE